MDCPFLSEDGMCRGPYQGFGCIGEKCKASRDLECPHLVDGYFCAKYHRFGCPGMANCSSLEEYMAFFRRERAQIPL